MPRVTCPNCDELVRVPDDGRAVRCPACHTRIGLDPPDDDGDDEERDERMPQFRKKRKRGRGPEPIRGLIALIILGPIGLALAVASIFNVKAALAAAIIGFIGTCAAALCLFSLYKKEGEESFTEGGGSWGSYFARMGLGLKKPRTFGSWMFLELLFGFIMLEGFTLVVILPKLGIHPHGALHAGAEQVPAGPNQPDGGPNQPAGVNEPSPEDRTITRLLGDLDKPDETSRRLSAAALAEMKPKAERRAEVVRKLTERVDDPNDGVRYQATLALGVWGGPDDVPTLIRLLTAPDNLTRSAAVIAVRRFRDPRAIPGLIRCLEDAASSKAGIAALVEIGPAAEKDLIKEISNKDSPVLGAAIAVLKDIGTPASLPALRAIANDPKKAYVGQLVRQAIKQINARAKKDTGK